jgi:hypothetical protein
MKKKEHAAAEGDSFLSRMGHAGGGTAPGKLAPLAPPPGQPAGVLAAPPQQPAGDLLGWGPAGSGAAPAAPAAAASPAPAAEEGWATFD